MTPITAETFHELEPGAKLNRIIAENVLRFEWSNRDNQLDTKIWHKDGDVLFHVYFKPSTDLNSAMQAIRRYIDDRPKWKIDLAMNREKGLWKVTLTLGYQNESYSHLGEDLPFLICQCLVEAYLHYGPQDYKKFGWL